MKTRILIGALAATMGLSSIADACHKGAHHSKAVKGTVTSVGKNSLSLATAENENLTVDYPAGTSAVTGRTRHGIDSSMIGKTVTVTGTQEGNVISASKIAIAATSAHGKPAA